jgi:hypothetical protein
VSSDKKESFNELLNNSTKKLSIKEIHDLTGLPRTTIKRYCQEIGYETVPYKREPWNKGETKYNNSIVKGSAQKKKGQKRGSHTKETKNKISNTMKANGVSGGYRIGSGRGTKYKYGGYTFESRTIMDFALKLDKEKIEWTYSDMGFYLVDYDLYLKVKFNVPEEARVTLMDKAKELGIKLILVNELVHRRMSYNGIDNFIKNLK